VYNHTPCINPPLKILGLKKFRTPSKIWLKNWSPLNILCHKVGTFPVPNCIWIQYFTVTRTRPIPLNKSLRLDLWKPLIFSSHVHCIHMSVRCRVRLTDNVLVAATHGVVSCHLLRVGCGSVYAMVTALRAWRLVRWRIVVRINHAVYHGIVWWRGVRCIRPI
jgi:hypothetical protein